MRSIADSRSLACCISVLLTLFVVAWTHVVPRWGAWYSDHLVFRLQTERLLNGHIGLSQNPAAISWDLAWGNGTVEQIWGLGVPCWRLLFEGIARLAGQDRFPDRLAFVIALGAVSYVLVRFHLL